METKHTPGPWSVAKCRYGFAVYASKSGDAVVQTEDVEGRYGAIDNEADARLIAAAPESHEANKLSLTVLCAIRAAGVLSHDTNILRDLDSAIGAARAAIAKARGETC